MISELVVFVPGSASSRKALLLAHWWYVWWGARLCPMINEVFKERNNLSVMAGSCLIKYLLLKTYFFHSTHSVLSYLNLIDSKILFYSTSAGLDPILNPHCRALPLFFFFSHDPSTANINNPSSTLTYTFYIKNQNEIFVF